MIFFAISDCIITSILLSENLSSRLRLQMRQLNVTSFYRLHKFYYFYAVE